MHNYNMKQWIVEMLNFYNGKFKDIAHKNFNYSDMNDTEKENFGHETFIVEHSFYCFMYDLLDLTDNKPREDKIITLRDFDVSNEEIHECDKIKNICSCRKHLWANPAELHWSSWEPQYSGVLPDHLDDKNYAQINENLKHDTLKKMSTMIEIFDNENVSVIKGKNNGEISFYEQDDEFFIFINGKKNKLLKNKKYWVYYGIPGISCFCGTGDETPETRMIQIVQNLIKKHISKGGTNE